MQVDGTLTLDDATITGQFGIIHSNCGTIDVIGSSEIDNTSLSLGQVNVESNQTLTLDNAVLDSDTVTLVSAVVHDHDVGANLRVEDTLFLVNATVNGTGTIDNCGTIDVQGDGSQSEIDGVTIANHGSLQIDGGATLVLNDVAVHGGSIDGTDASGCIVASTIDVTGDSTFGDLAVEKGNLTIDDSAALKIADHTTVTFDGVHVTDNGALDVGVRFGCDPRPRRRHGHRRLRHDDDQCQRHARRRRRHQHDQSRRHDHQSTARSRRAAAARWISSATSTTAPARYWRRPAACSTSRARSAAARLPLTMARWSSAPSPTWT